MAKAPAKAGKKKVFKKKEKKVVPSDRKRGRLVQRGFSGFSRFAQGNSVCRAAGVAHRRQ
jgi:hypothetical protein